MKGGGEELERVKEKEEEEKGEDGWDPEEPVSYCLKKEKERG